MKMNRLKQQHNTLWLKYVLKFDIYNLFVYISQLTKFPPSDLVSQEHCCGTFLCVIACISQQVALIVLQTETSINQSHYQLTKSAVYII